MTFNSSNKTVTVNAHFDEYFEMAPSWYRQNLHKYAWGAVIIILSFRRLILASYYLFRARRHL